MTANDSKFYLSYLNKLVYQYNNTYYNSIGKKPINGDYSPLIEKIETTFKALKFKVNNRAILSKCRNIFSKSYTEDWSRETFIINSLLITNPWTHKIKYFIEKKLEKWRKKFVVEEVINELVSRSRQSYYR